MPMENRILLKLDPKIGYPMRTKIKYILPILVFACFLADLGLAQDNALGGDLASRHYPDSSGGPHHVVLIPELDRASLKDGDVTIPFILKNESDQDVSLAFVGNKIEALYTVNENGKIRSIQSLHSPANYIGMQSGPSFWVTLRPGESTSHFSSVYSVEILAEVTGRQIFGALHGYIKEAGKWSQFGSDSAPFVVPPALTTIPWTDLGTQSYLSLTLDWTRASISGMSLRNAVKNAPSATHTFADLLKGGWEGNLLIPITVINVSNQDVVVAIDEVRFYILGDDREKNRLARDERWEYAKASTPILKPGESINSTGRDYIILSWLKNNDYKQGDKIIAMVGGRIPGTNNIFECYSAPFELPPLPKGEPPAGK